MGKDPRFPDRPDTPDFWALSAAVRTVDAMADAGEPVEKIISPYADFEAVVYVVQHRSRRLLGLVPDARQQEPLLTLMAGWLDGFAAGLRYPEHRYPRDGQHR